MKAQRYDNKLTLIGFDCPQADIIKIEGDILTIKIKGHSYWSAHSEQSYQPAEYRVYKIDGEIDNTMELIQLTTFPVRS